MVDRDVVLEKVKQIQRCLKRIYDRTGGRARNLSDIDVQDIVVLNLQRAIQSSLDLAAHIIADEGLGLVSELRENFVLLERKKIISKKLSEKLQRMVGFRNIAVHEYAEIDDEVLEAILDHHLKDIELFYKCVLKYGGITV